MLSDREGGNSFPFTFDPPPLAPAQHDRVGGIIRLAAVDVDKSAGEAARVVRVEGNQLNVMN